MLNTMRLVVFLLFVCVSLAAGNEKACEYDERTPVTIRETPEKTIAAFNNETGCSLPMAAVSKIHQVDEGIGYLSYSEIAEIVAASIPVPSPPLPKIAEVAIPTPIAVERVVPAVLLNGNDMISAPRIKRAKLTFPKVAYRSIPPVSEPANAKLAAVPPTQASVAPIVRNADRRASFKLARVKTVTTAPVQTTSAPAPAAQPSTENELVNLRVIIKEMETRMKKLEAAKLPPPPPAANPQLPQLPPLFDRASFILLSLLPIVAMLCITTTLRVTSRDLETQMGIGRAAYRISRFVPDIFYSAHYILKRLLEHSRNKGGGDKGSNRGDPDQGYHAAIKAKESQKGDERRKFTAEEIFDDFERRNRPSAASEPPAN